VCGYVSDPLYYKHTLGSFAIRSEIQLYESFLEVSAGLDVGLIQQSHVLCCVVLYSLLLTA
jgi:hypothetical protein